MKEQALNEILNILDVRSDAIAFKDITYGRLIESAIEDGDALYKSINISRDVLSYWMKKTFPEKEENNLQSIPAKENLEKSNKFDPDYIEDLIMQELALDGLAYYEFEENLLDIAC